MSVGQTNMTRSCRGEIKDHSKSRGLSPTTRTTSSNMPIVNSSTYTTHSNPCDLFAHHVSRFAKPLWISDRADKENYPGTKEVREVSASQDVRANSSCSRSCAGST